jgi:hypothetical protein
MAEDPSGNFGKLQTIEKTADGYIASGTCEFNDQGPDAIILAYKIDDNDPIAFALTHPVKPPASIFRGPAKSGAWQVRFTPAQLPASSTTITAWGFDATHARVFRLGGELQIDAMH